MDGVIEHRTNELHRIRAETMLDELGDFDELNEGIIWKIPFDDLLNSWSVVGRVEDMILPSKVDTMEKRYKHEITRVQFPTTL